MSAVVVGGAVIGAGASIYAGNQAGGAAKDAANQQTQTAMMAQAQQGQQFERIQALLNPYVSASTGTFDGAAYLRANPDIAADPVYGGDPYRHYIEHGRAEGRQATMSAPGSLAGQQDLLGLNGNAAQGAAISNIENSPYFSGLVQQGENAILQNASATGGLRGGNTQGALAQFRPNMLAAAIDQQYQRLAGITSLGQNAAAGVGNAGMNMANNNSQLFGQIGAAQAGGIIGQARGQAQAINGISSAFGAVAPVISGYMNQQPATVTGGAATAGTPYATGGLNNNFGGQPVYF